MIVTIAHLQLRPGTFEDFERAVSAVVPPSLAEDGAISYEVYRGLGGSEQVIFVEQWTDRGALDRHFGEPHFKAFDQALAPLLDGQPSVVVHEVESSVTL